MEIKLWGVRGSIPSPMGNAEFHRKLRESLHRARQLWIKDPHLEADQIIDLLPAGFMKVIGGETTCVEVKSGESQLILDMGTGARKLGYDMMARNRFGDVHILLTHTHWDHIQGWPFFVPGYIPTNHVHFYSGHMNCEERMIRQQHFDHFPLTWAEMRSTRDFNIFHPGDSFEIGPFKIRTFLLTHPGESIAYRIEAEGKVFIFSTDTEFFGTDLADQIQRADSFFRAADMLLMDAQYTVDESSQKIGWGHTAMDIAVDCASAWGVKHLVLTHHEPAHEDDRILSMFSDTLKHYEEIRKDRPRMNINLAFESDTYRL